MDPKPEITPAVPPSAGPPPSFSAVAAFEAEHPEAAALLRRVLRSDERIGLITSGWRSWFLDDVFAGLPTLLGNRTLIVGTDQRILLVHTGLRGLRPRGYLSEIPRECLLGTLGAPLLSLFTTRGTVRLLGVPFTGKRKLAMPLDPDRNASGAPAMLCPACFRPHQERVETCPCGCRLKSPVGAGLRNLVVPGWGDAWLGSPWTGLLTALAVGFLWLNLGALVRAGGAVDVGSTVHEVTRTFALLVGSSHLAAALVGFLRGRRSLIAESGELPA